MKSVICGIHEQARELENGMGRQIFLPFQDGQLIVLKPSEWQLVDDPTVKIRQGYDAKYAHQKERIVREMLEDPKFRNFMCVDLKSILRELARRNHSVSPVEDWGGESDADEKPFQISSSFAITPQSRQDQDDSLSLLLVAQIRHQLSIIMGVSSEKLTAADFIEPAKKLFEIIGKGRVEKDGVFISRDDATTKEVQDALVAWQNNVFFESFVAKILQDALQIPVLPNPLIVFNLTEVNRETPVLEGYFELDGFIASKNGKTLLVECKNSKRLRRSYVTNFLGKVDYLERVYKTEIRKCLFCSGPLGLFDRGDLDKRPRNQSDAATGASDAAFFGRPDFQKNFPNAIQYCKTSLQ